MSASRDLTVRPLEARFEGEVDAAAEEQVLRERARELAGRDVEGATREVLARVVVVRCSASLLGLPIDAMSKVREVTLTRLPLAPPPVRALFHLWGRVIALVDIAADEREVVPVHGARALVALVVGAPGTVGVRIDEVIGVRDLFVDEVGPAEGRVTTAVTRDLVQIVDVERLFAAVVPRQA